MDMMRKLLLSIFLLFALNTLHAQLQEVSYWDGAQKLNGWMTSSHNTKGAVLILPA